MTTIVITDSDTMHQAEYSPDEEILRVTGVNGKVKAYHAVTMEMFSEFERACRMGMFHLKQAESSLGKPIVEKANLAEFKLTGEV